MEPINEYAKLAVIVSIIGTLCFLVYQAYEYLIQRTFEQEQEEERLFNEGKRRFEFIRSNILNSKTYLDLKNTIDFSLSDFNEEFRNHPCFPTYKEMIDQLLKLRKSQLLKNQIN